MMQFASKSWVQDLMKKVLKKFKASEVDPLTNYSTEPQAIGTWVDGKTIYRKVIVTTTPTVQSEGTTASKTVALLGVNIDKVISISACSDYHISSEDHGAVGTFYCAPGQQITAWINTATNAIHVASNLTWASNQELRIILEYTEA